MSVLEDDVAVYLNQAADALLDPDARGQLSPSELAGKLRAASLEIETLRKDRGQREHNFAAVRSQVTPLLRRAGECNERALELLEAQST